MQRWDTWGGWCFECYPAHSLITIDTFPTSSRLPASRSPGSTHRTALSAPPFRPYRLVKFLSPFTSPRVKIVLANEKLWLSTAEQRREDVYSSSARRELGEDEY